MCKLQVHCDAVQPGITIPTNTDVVSANLSRLSSDHILSSDEDNIVRRRPLSEPCATTDLHLKSDVQTLTKTLRSAELLKQADTDNMVSSSTSSPTMSSSNRTVCMTSTCDNSHKASSLIQDDYSRHVSDVLRPSVDSCASNLSGFTSTVAVDEKYQYQFNYVPTAGNGLTGSVWRKIRPDGGRSGTTAVNVSEESVVKCLSSSVPALNDAVMSSVIGLSLQDSLSRTVNVDDVCKADEHREQGISSDVTSSRHVDTSHNDDEDVCCLRLTSASESRVDADDSETSHTETGYDLIDNNVVTAHQLRDDVPDSELIDYSDDASESLLDSSSCASVKHQVHVFIALFDYDPATMSPNPDAVESELPFSEGQLIKVRFAIISTSMHVISTFYTVSHKNMPCSRVMDYTVSQKSSHL